MEEETGEGLWKEVGGFMGHLFAERGYLLNIIDAGGIQHKGYGIFAGLYFADKLILILIIIDVILASYLFSYIE